jgi:hypothetical protein
MIVWLVQETPKTRSQISQTCSASSLALAFDAEALQSEGGYGCMAFKPVSDEVHLEVLGSSDCICMITGSRPWRDYLQSSDFQLSCPIFMVSLHL